MTTKRINDTQYITECDFGSYAPDLDDIISSIPNGHKLIGFSILPTKISSAGTSHRAFVGFFATEIIDKKQS